MGRRLSAGEIYRMTSALNVYNAKQSRSKSENWAKWAEEHPRANALLIEVERILSDEENG